MPDFFDPPTELQNVVLVSGETLRKAERLIVGCEGCAPRESAIPFDWILDTITGSDPSMTDYVMVECMAKCPDCRRQMNEKTLVEIDA